MFNLSHIRDDFPILNRKIAERKLVYLDNAALTQIPRPVVQRMTEYEFNSRANVFRGIYTLGDESTNLYEEARKNVADFIGANVSDEVVFTKNATESINMVSVAWGHANLNKGDVVLVSDIEHNSNLLPWISLEKSVGIVVAKIPVKKDGDLEVAKTEVDWSKVRFMSLSHVASVLGNVNDIQSIIKFVKKKSGRDIRVMVDGTGMVGHLPVKIKTLGCDFYAFSSAKLYGPMGVGVLWINRNIFDEIKEYTYGGGMVKFIENENEPTYKGLPYRLESGTPNISGVIGLSAAIDYLKNLGLEHVYNHTRSMCEQALNALTQIPDLEIYGKLDHKNRLPIISFNIKGVPSHDVSAILDMNGIEVRSGLQCVISWHKKNDVKTTVRASFALYNTPDEIVQLVEAIKSVKSTFRY